MKSVRRMTLCLLAILTVVNFPFITMADSPTLSDFTFSSVATLSDSSSSLNIQITVSGPEAEASKISGVYCTIAADGTSLGTANGLGSNIKACNTGEAAYVSSQDMTVLVIGSSSNQTTIPQGTPVTFSLDYDISELNLSNGTKITVSIPKSGSLCTWNGAIAKGFTVGTELTSCTISSSGGSISSSAVPEEDITNSANASVISSVSDGTATLNVASEKACVVAYTTDEGKTYTRVNAAQADSGYDFVVPDYSENMKFVVGLSGDADGDGSVGTSDYTAIARSLLLPENGRYQALSAVNSVFADADGDGSVGTSDYTAIARSLLLESNARYAAIEWK